MKVLTQLVNVARNVAPRQIWRCSCGHGPALFTQPLPASRLLSSINNTDRKSADISENPFFDKYKSKIQHMQNTNPEEYNERLRDMREKSKSQKVAQAEQDKTSSSEVSPLKVAPPSETARTGAGMTASKNLAAILKMDLIENKTAAEITEIWNLYHKEKDCLYSVIQADEYNNLMEKSRQCPVFVYPVKRNEGHEFILSQFDRNEVYFTPLGMFQLVKENAPPCLIVTHYTELLNSKGIVLMTGEFDAKVLSKQVALGLVQQMSVFYGKDLRFYDIVYRFNFQPATFKYQELIAALDYMPQYETKVEVH